MNNPVTTTTTARGAAVSSSRITEVQSVYMGRAIRARTRTIVRLVFLVLLAALPVQAGVEFSDCTTGTDGSITCDTQPTGDTLTDDIEARFGLEEQASPGWSEFNPDEGFDQDFGDNGT
jgi:hypothetical protein